MQRTHRWWELKFRTLFICNIKFELLNAILALVDNYGIILNYVTTLVTNTTEQNDVFFHFHVWTWEKRKKFSCYGLQPFRRGMFWNSVHYVVSICVAVTIERWWLKGHAMSFITMAFTIFHFTLSWRNTKGWESLWNGKSADIDRTGENVFETHKQFISEITDWIAGHNLYWMPETERI